MQAIKLHAANEVVGDVIEINRAHRWFRVEYTCGVYTNHETFKF